MSSQYHKLNIYSFSSGIRSHTKSNSGWNPIPVGIRL